ncbi:MAG TPA: ABC transporter permease [Gemmatimonadaceae bacterium]
MATLRRDFAYAIRTLRKNPAFSITAIVTLALGIGATTAIFSVTNAVLLRPLPYDKPDQLTIIWGELRQRNVYDWTFAPGDLKDVMDQGTLFQGIAGISTGTAALTTTDAPPQQIRFARVTTNTFDVLGVKLARGRNFTAEDGRPQPQPPASLPGQVAPQGPPPVRLPNIGVLSFEFWARQYGSDPTIVGKNIEINGGPVEVVGVLEPGAELVFPPKSGVERLPDIWISARIDFAADVARNNVGIFAVGRMKPGVSVAQASQQMDNIARALWDRFPLKKTVDLHFRAEAMKENTVATVKPTINALMGAVFFVLLIACANVANLLLVRVSTREREMAVRAAIGGSHWDITRQLLAESLTLSVAGGLLGLGLAWGGIKVLLSMAPADLPRMEGVAIDPTVLGFTMIACVLSSVIFGLVPAIRASRPELTGVLRSGGRGLAGGHGTLLRRGVVMAEVALSFVLLIGCGLMIRSAIALNRVDPGFDHKGVLTFNLGNFRFRTPDEANARAQAVQQQLGGLPGVKGVSMVGQFPLDPRPSNGRWGREESKADPSKYRQGQFAFIPPGYLGVMRAHLIDGRDFDASDLVPNARTVILDDQAAKLAFGNESAVGKTILARLGNPDADPYTVIGVVKHMRHTSLTGDEKETIIFPTQFARAWLVRTDGDPNRLVTSVRSTLNAIDPQMMVTDMKPLSDNIDRAMAPTRFALGLISVFAALAVLLAGIGLYGVLSSLVRQRVNEIGVRMAFGAQPSGIFRVVVGQGLGLSAVGVGAGLLGSFFLTRTMAKLLVGVSPTDATTFAGMTVVFFAIAVLASWLPARRAANVQPNVALMEG